METVSLATSATLDFIYSSVLKRVQAIMIDGAVVLGVFVLAYNIIDVLDHTPAFIRGGILIFMFFLYEPLLIAFAGGTIGHHILKMRVRNATEYFKKYQPTPILTAFPDENPSWSAFLHYHKL